MKLTGAALVQIVILNWNGWADTLECLESLFRLEYPRYRVVVCDNGSTDGSLDYFRAWAEGRLCLGMIGSPLSRRLTHPPVPKPIHYLEFTKAEVESGLILSEDLPLALIHNGANLGFAGGNNVGLRFALGEPETGYVWLLNNDTVVEPTSLCRLVERMEEKPAAGICGSTLLFYRHPDTVQALGGATYNRWLGSNRHLGLHVNTRRKVDQDCVERQMDYVIGASMLVRRLFLETIGLMDERYFLYFEELDWATRAKGRFSLAFSADSIVYHKEGGSAGTSSTKKGKSLLSDYYSLRNRLVFTKKFFPLALPLVYAGIGVALLNRIRRGQPDHSKMIGRLLLSCGSCAPPMIDHEPLP